MKVYYKNIQSRNRCLLYVEVISGGEGCLFCVCVCFALLIFKSLTPSLHMLFFCIVSE